MILVTYVCWLLVISIFRFLFIFRINITFAATNFNLTYLIRLMFTFLLILIKSLSRINKTEQDTNKVTVAEAKSIFIYKKEL